MCLWKLKSLSKITPRLRTLSYGDISLSSNLTGKWLESLYLCCFVPIIINSVLLELLRIAYASVMCVHINNEELLFNAFPLEHSYWFSYRY